MTPIVYWVDQETSFIYGAQKRVKISTSVAQTGSQIVLGQLVQIVIFMHFQGYHISCG